MCRYVNRVSGVKGKLTNIPIGVLTTLSLYTPACVKTTFVITKQEE